MKYKTAQLRRLTINFQVFLKHAVLVLRMQTTYFLPKMKSSIIKLNTLPNKLFGLNLLDMCTKLTTPQLCSTQIKLFFHRQIVMSGPAVTVTPHVASNLTVTDY